MTATEGFMRAEIEKLEKENKELKEYWSIEIKTCNRYREKCDKLEKENKQLKENIETLEMWLDNKDKLLEEYRKKLDKFMGQTIYEEGLYN